MLRMTSSGTEASMTAIRLARAATGREQMLKFAGAYHGHVDGLLAQAGSGLATQGLPGEPGRAAERGGRHGGRAVERRRGADRGDRALRACGDPRRAAAGEHGAGPPARRVPGAAARAADATGALLVLDEVISGFRVARGGAQELTGVGADLTIMGKVIGGGLPAAALGGRAELMRMLAPAGDVYRRARCRATRWRWRPAWRRCSCSTKLRTRAWRRRPSGWRAGLREAAGDSGRSSPAPGLLTVFFSERSPTTWRVRRRATSTPTAAGVASCWRGVSTRRRRSSRRGSRPWHKVPSTSTDRRGGAAAFAELRGAPVRA